MAHLEKVFVAVASSLLRDLNPPPNLSCRRAAPLAKIPRVAARDAGETLGEDLLVDAGAASLVYFLFSEEVHEELVRLAFSEHLGQDDGM